MNEMPAEESRREAHDKALEKYPETIRAILSTLRRAHPEPLTAIEISMRTGIGLLTVRPRLTELAQFNFCMDKYGTSAILVQAGRKKVWPDSLAVTAYNMNEAVTHNPCYTCSGKGWIGKDKEICPACCGSGTKPPQTELGGRDGLD